MRYSPCLLLERVRALRAIGLLCVSVRGLELLVGGGYGACLGYVLGDLAA